MINSGIRLAVESDADALLAVYAPYVEKTAVTFEYEVPSPGEFARRIRDVTSFYPWLICEKDGKTAGYAYAHRHKERAAYQWGCELSVYLAQGFMGQGLGAALYQTLIRILQLQNIYNLYACVTLPNKRSERLHEALGFSPAGIWRHTGYKLGAWHDVVWYERICPRTFSADSGSPTGNAEAFAGLPKPLLSFHEIDPAVIAAILQE